MNDMFMRVNNSTARSLKGAASRNVNNFFRNDDFSGFLIVHITEIFHYFSQNIGVILKMDS